MLQSTGHLNDTPETIGSHVPAKAGLEVRLYRALVELLSGIQPWFGESSTEPELVRQHDIGAHVQTLDQVRRVSCDLPAQQSFQIEIWRELRTAAR